MASFKFNLETVLKLKIQLENSAKNEVGKAVSFLEKQKQLLFDLENKMVEIILERNTLARKTTVKNLRDYSGFLKYINEKIDEQKIMVNHAEKNVDILTKKLIEASKDRKIFEKLKEKKYHEYLMEEQKKDEKLIDELISFKLNK
jgi:flagellar FliJ protein